MNEVLTEPVRAAGAVVWRGDESAPEVALIHRPKYDDWTFPKGKLKSGEHVVVAALREVAEETGLVLSLGRHLPPVHYFKDGKLKRVDYWSARVVGNVGAIDPTDEVDHIEWLSLGQAYERLTYERDAELLQALTDSPVRSVPLILVRHALAVPRQDGIDDDERPLVPEGEEQAALLAEVLAGYRPTVLLSSPAKRCVQTILPYAREHGIDIRTERMFTETDYNPTGALELVSSVLGSGEPAVVCGHGKVLPDLIAAVAKRHDHAAPGETSLPKGGFAVMPHTDGQVITVERYAV